MSFKGEFKVAGNTYSVIQCSFHLKQKYGHNGKPASGVHTGSVTMILEGTDDGTFGSWIGDPTKKQDGKIIFYRADQADTKFKEVTLEWAYLMTLMESFILENEISQTLLMEGETIVTDIGPGDDEDKMTRKFASLDLLNCQKATGRSYCILLRISVGKITIDGVEHEN